jgi:hypothetical protein
MIQTCSNRWGSMKWEPCQIPCPVRCLCRLWVDPRLARAPSISSPQSHTAQRSRPPVWRSLFGYPGTTAMNAQVTWASEEVPNLWTKGPCLKAAARGMRHYIYIRTLPHIYTYTTARTDLSIGIASQRFTVLSSPRVGLAPAAARSQPRCRFLARDVS